MKEQIDGILMDLHYLLNDIADLPPSEYKVNLWTKTQEVCDIAIYERPTK